MIIMQTYHPTQIKITENLNPNLNFSSPRHGHRRRCRPSSAHLPDRRPPLQQGGPPRVPHRFASGAAAEKGGRPRVRRLADRRAAADPISELHQRACADQQHSRSSVVDQRQCNRSRHNVSQQSCGRESQQSQQRESADIVAGVNRRAAVAVDRCCY